MQAAKRSILRNRSVKLRALATCQIKKKKVLHPNSDVTYLFSRRILLNLARELRQRRRCRSLIELQVIADEIWTHMYPRLLVPPERLNTKKKKAKKNFLSFVVAAFLFFLIANKRYFNSCQDDNGCPNVLFDVFRASRASGRERAVQRERHRGKAAHKWQ